MKIFFSSRCLEYEFPGHPESPERVRISSDYLRGKGWHFAEPSPCAEQQILAVHARRLVESVRTGGFYDPDTPALPGIYDYALLAAGSAVGAMECALGGEASFSLMRPPGHHAEKARSMGFCYFNNMAVAVAAALSRVERAAIVDIDCHHGNGTEDIVLGDRRVLFVSLHQSPLYPGTGLFSRQNCLNFPLSPGTDGPPYLAALKDALERVEEFDPGVVGVSAGFDTYRNDPLTAFALDLGDYREIGRMLGGLRRPLFSLLEGGYDRALPACIESYLEGIGG